MAKNQSGCFSTILLQFFKGASAHDVDVDVDSAVDDRLRISLIEQVHEDAAILHGDTGVGGYRVAIDEAAVGGGDIQQGAVGDDIGVNGHGAVTQTQTGRTLARLGIIAGGLAGKNLAVAGGGVGGAVRAGQGRDGRTGAIGLDHMVGRLHGGGHIGNDAVFQLAVHPALPGGDGLLALRAMLQGGSTVGVAEVEAGIDVLRVVGDCLRLHLVLILDAVDFDLAASRDHRAEGGFGIVVPLQSDAGTFQSIGDGTHHHLDGVLLTFSLNGDAEGALDVQGCQTTGKGSVVDFVSLLGLDAGKAHNAGRVALGSEDHLPRTVGVCDVGQPQIRGGHSQREHETRSHDAERQHTG